MKLPAHASLTFLTATSLLVFSACGDDESPSQGAAGESAHGGAQHAGGTAAHEGGAAHGGADTHGAGSAECEVLGSLCHAADSGTGPASECHELGHVGDAEACEAEFASCINVCVPAEGAGGAGGGGSDPAGSPYCVALGELCHAAADHDAAADACHELGHVGDAVKCQAGFTDCATLCLGLLAETGAGGAH